MKVCFDHQIFSLQRYGGVSRYFAEIISIFQKMEETEVLLPIRYSINSYMEQLQIIQQKTIFSRQDFSLQTKLHSLINQLMAKRKIKKANFDIFHPTYYNPYFFQALNKRPFVLTVYDMTHEIFPDHFPGTKEAERKKFLIEKATKIIAISESTKQDILKFNTIDESKITVTPLAASILPDDQLTQIKLPENYLLFVGQRHQYKNFDLFIKAAATVMLKQQDLYLRCAGGGAFTKKEQATLIELNIADRTEQLDVNDNALGTLYKNALCFIFPSTYEGFGIPTLESLGYGCPAALSNCSSLPEIAGSACEYFNPQDRSSIEEAIEKIVFNSKRREELINLGTKQFSQFSWQKTAEATLDIYREI